MQPQPRNNYSAADIERYYNGSMPPAEMHALEKAALDDPFLADALEGYVHTQTSAADVKVLKERVQRRSRNVVPLHRNRRILLSIAAMLILLIGFGWLAYQFSNTNKRNIALQSSPQPTVKETRLTTKDTAGKIPEETTTIKNPANQPENNDSQKSTNEKSLSMHEETAARTTQPAKNEPAIADQPTFSKPHLAAAPQTNAETKMALKKRAANTFQARVVDEYNKPVPFATITNPNTTTVAQADAAGDFAIAAPDSTVTIHVQAVGFLPQTDTLSLTDKNTAIVLERGENSLNEVIVTGNGKQKKEANRVQLEAVEPVIGRKRFNEYVIGNLDTAQAKHKIYTGDVVLLFDVDEEGNAVNIAVEKPLCASCDSTAVRLVQQGSRWTKTGAGKARARIRF